MKRTLSLTTAALTTIALSASLTSQELVAIKADRVLTMDGGELQNAVILIENGKIKEIGTDVEVPWNAKVIDASGKIVMPTYTLAHTSGGMSGENEKMSNVPYLTVEDAVDPSSRFFEECLRNGIGCAHVIPGNSTLIGGQGMVVRPYGKTVEDMTVSDKGGMKLSLAASGSKSRMAQIRELRNALKEAVDYREDYERRKQEFEKEKEAGATEKQEFEKPDELKKPLLDLLEGKITAFLYVPSAAEVAEVARLKEQHGLKLVLVLGPRCYKAAEKIAALDVPVILDADCLEYYEKDPETGDETLVCPAKVFADAGIEFALSIASSTSGSKRYPWWQMGTAIRHGLDRDVALAAMTTRPLQILGLDAEFGTIAPGKVANLQILTGDPLKATSWVDMILLEGEIVYERDKDLRLQHLFGKTKD